MVQEMEGWAAFLDIYGFSAMRVELGALNLARRLAQCHSEIEQRLPWSRRRPIRLKFQDSLLLFYRVSRRHQDRVSILHDCIADVQEILAIFADKALPIRGSIAFGTAVYNGSFLFGQAPEQAYKCERTLPGPLVLLPVSECYAASIGTDEHFPVAAPKMREIHLKGQELIFGKLVLPIPKDSFISLIISNYRKFASIGRGDIAKAWEDTFQVLVEYEVQDADE
jgi:hypothetical protein